MNSDNTPNAAYRRIEDHINSIRKEMLNLDARNSTRLQERLEKLSDTNCWWATYWAKDLMIRLMKEARIE